MATNEECSNIVTPPDFISSIAHTVLLIDPTHQEIEEVAFFLKTAADVFTVYVYCEGMNNREWLKAAMAKSSAVVVNTESNADSPYKDRLATKKGEIYHYGDKKFLMAMDRRISSPVEYFINYTSKGK